jgi:hypothetical protein
LKAQRKPLKKSAMSVNTTAVIGFQSSNLLNTSLQVHCYMTLCDMHYFVGCNNIIVQSKQGYSGPQTTLKVMKTIFNKSGVSYVRVNLYAVERQTDSPGDPRNKLKAYQSPSACCSAAL